MCIGLQVKYLFFLSDFNENVTFLIYFRKNCFNIKFPKNPSSRSPAVLWGQTDRQTYEVNSRLLQFFESA